MSIEKEIHTTLLSQKLTVGVAESCTGGLISDLFITNPGSSEYFLGGIVAYSNAAKTSLLNIPVSLLDEFGAVSREVSLEMARGAKSAFSSDIALSSTGVAGPGGGSPDKPVGTVWLSIVTNELEHSCLFYYPVERSECRKKSAGCALDLLHKYLHGDSMPERVSD